MNRSIFASTDDSWVGELALALLFTMINNPIEGDSSAFSRWVWQNARLVDIGDGHCNLLRRGGAFYDGRIAFAKSTKAAADACRYAPRTIESRESTRDSEAEFCRAFKR